MKQLKKLTRVQKIRMSKKGFNPAKYALKHEDKTCFIVVPKDGGNEIKFDK